MVEKPEELDSSARGSAPDAQTVGPEDGAGLSSQAGFGPILGYGRRGGSGGLPEAMVLLGDAQPASAGHPGGEDDQALLEGGHRLPGDAGDERDGRRLELEDQDGHEAGLRVQACRLSPDHRLSRRRALSLQSPTVNGREPKFLIIGKPSV